MKFMLPCRFGERYKYRRNAVIPEYDPYMVVQKPYLRLHTLDFTGGFVTDFLNEVYICDVHHLVPCRPDHRYKEKARDPEWAKKFSEYWFEPKYALELPDWLFHDFDLSQIAPYVSGIGHLSNANYHADGRLHYRFLGKKLKSPVITTSDVIDRYFAEVLPPVSQPMYYYFYEEEKDGARRIHHRRA